MTAPDTAQALRNTPLFDELRARFGEQFSTSAAVREQHGKDESYHGVVPPDGVVFARDKEDVRDAVLICAKHDSPIIPFGTGTSLEGHVAALKGGISLDVSQMNRILAVNAEDMDAVVEPGVTRKQLNEHLRDRGLFFPVDPGADASIGGMTATRASGTNAVRYGTMRESVLALEVVLADGRVIRTSKRARKSAAGYDLTRLFIGSEGTLGVITEVTVRLFGIPEAMSSAVCSFPTLEAAVNTVILTIQAGIPIARIELLDQLMMDAVNKHSKLSYPVAPTLFLEFHGSEAGVKEQAEFVEGVAKEHGAADFQWTTKAEERSKLWQARHDAGYAAMAYRPGHRIWPTDVCVPISRLADCILATQKDMEGSFLDAPIVGHVGDGNFHLTILVEPNNPKHLAGAQRINERLVMRALAMDGTSTGEHGIGHGKLDFLVAEHGEAVSVMRSIKQALDPRNLMNPGKILRP